MSNDDKRPRVRRLVSNPKTRSRTRFPPRRTPQNMSPATMSSNPSTPPTPASRFEEILDDSLSDLPDTTFENNPYSAYPWNPGNQYIPPAMPPKPPDLFSTLPILRDIYTTPTSIEQDKTCTRVLPLLSSRDDPLPHLDRDAHIMFLESGLDDGKLPYYMTTLDASRPWIIYWCLTGLSLLGVDISQYRDR